ncbi:MAG: hypothetical protein JNM84_26205 [Planctomycetes bacterium]|nr:hypothetical protein [Planctomycetota bacterium]
MNAFRLPSRIPHARGLCCLAITVATLAPLSSAQIQVSYGFGSQRYAVATAGTFPGGFAVAPNGNLVLFDGAAIVERDRRGGFVRTVYSAAPTFGSFLRFSPDGTKLYFGESGAGNLLELAWPSGSARNLSNIDFNYDIAFDAQGVPYVSANPGFAGQVIFRVDPVTGALDRIAALPGASGPIVFGAGDALYAMIVPGTFPPPPGAFSVVRYSAAQIQSAIGAGELGAAQATAVLTGLNGGSNLAIDGEARLLLTTGNALLAFADGGAPETLVSAGPNDYLGGFAFEFGTSPFFRPLGDPSGGTAILTSTDFASTYDAVEITPSRARFGISAPNPVPPGPLSILLAGARPHAPLILWIAQQRLAPELPIFTPRPFLLGCDPTTLLVALPAQANNVGDVFFQFQVPAGASGYSSIWQGLYFDALGAYASSEPIEIVLQ